MTLPFQAIHQDRQQAQQAVALVSTATRAAIVPQVVPVVPQVVPVVPLGVPVVPLAVLVVPLGVLVLQALSTCSTTGLMLTVSPSLDP